MGTRLQNIKKGERGVKLEKTGTVRVDWRVGNRKGGREC